MRLALTYDLRTQGLPSSLLHSNLVLAMNTKPVISLLYTLTATAQSGVELILWFRILSSSRPGFYISGGALYLVVVLGLNEITGLTSCFFTDGILNNFFNGFVVAVVAF